VGNSKQAKEEVAARSYYGETVLDPTLAQQLSSHPLPFWGERMATAYVRCEGGNVQRDLFSYTLEWPDGSRMERVSFQSRDAQDKGLQHVSLEDARIRRLVQQLPRVVVTEPIPCVRFASLPAEVVGYWSLWRIAIDKQSLRDVKIIPIFHHDHGRNLVPTARHNWDALMEDRPEVEQVGTKTGPEVEAVFRRLRAEAERQGEDAFHDLHARHQERLKREQEKGNYAFQVLREALGRLGLHEDPACLADQAEEEAGPRGEFRQELYDADERHPAAAKAVGGGTMMALAPGKGILAHREAGGVIHTYVELKRPAEWVAGIDFTDATAAAARVAAEFDGWALELTALITDGEDAPVPRPLYTLPVGHRWNRVPGVTLLGDAAHLMPPSSDGANLAMLDGAELGKAIAAHPNNVEAALSAYEVAMFPRSERAAADAHQLRLDDRLPFGVSDFYTAVLGGEREDAAHS
jgi:hypothetical protein